jgi:hypothetical protein
MDSNKRTRNFAQRIAVNATLTVIAMLTLLVPAYSQQDIDPTWYNPWAELNQVAVQHPQSRPANRKTRREIRSAAAVRKNNRQTSVQTARDHERTREIAQSR